MAEVGIEPTSRALADPRMFPPGYSTLLLRRARHPIDSPGGAGVKTGANPAPSRREDKQSIGRSETIQRKNHNEKGGYLMKSYVAARALAALDEIRSLLQAAQFAAQKFEQDVMTQEPVESLSDDIQRAKTTADMLRARIQRSVRRAVVG